MKSARLFLVFCILLIAGCSNDETVSGMRVTVIDGQGLAVANAVVVLGTRDGSVASYGTTGSNGEAFFFSPPPGATVTAAISCIPPSSTRTYYYTDTAYDVNVSHVNLLLGSCGQNNDQVTVNVRDTLGVVSSEITLGPITYGGPTATMDVAYSLQDDGRISVFALGYDGGGAPMGYGLALDQPPVNGGMIDVVIDRTDLVRHTHSFANIPPQTVSYYMYASLLRKHAATNLPLNFSGGTVPLPPSITTYSVAGFSDTFNFGASLTLDRDNDGIPDAEVGLDRFLPSPADQVFDFASVPMIPVNLTCAVGTDGRPVMQWSDQDPLSTVQTLVLTYSTTAPKKTFQHSMTVPASATRIVYPALPQILADFRPAGYSNLRLQSIKFETPVSYQDFLKGAAAGKGRFQESAGLNKYSHAVISRVP